MSENSTLCGHPKTTPTDPLCYARVMLIVGGVSGSALQKREEEVEKGGRETEGSANVGIIGGGCGSAGLTSSSYA